MNARLGIIGGGQLALYLCQAARQLGVTCIVFADAKDSPALTAADESVSGSLEDTGVVRGFIARCDVVTFDKEAIAEPALQALIDAEHQGQIKVQPSVAIMQLLQDKGRQKAWLVAHELPTLPYESLDFAVPETDTAKVLANLRDHVGPSLVQKARRGGYDGRGVQILRADSGVELWPTPSIIEPFVADCVEVAVVTVRADSGELATYPPVSMEFDPQLNSVKTVVMPASISPQLAQQAMALAERAITLLGGVGVFAVEMFLIAEDELVINEISPRVHNSGHVTLNACNASQFEQHVRAIIGMPLVAIEQHSPAAMLNILYTEAMRPHCPGDPSVQTNDDNNTFVYWYGKVPGSAGRKMGHINAIAGDVDTAITRANAVLAELSGEKKELRP